MFLRTHIRILLSVFLLTPLATVAAPFGPPGQVAAYEAAEPAADAATTVARFRIATGQEETWNGKTGQWWRLEAVKRDETSFSIWILGDGVPPESLNEARAHVLRYLVQEDGAPPVEYRHAVTGEAVLPGSGAWTYLVPRPEKDGAPGEPFPETVTLLGHRYTRTSLTEGTPAALPADVVLHQLRPDVLTGVPHNTRQADETRRYDDSEYTYVPLVADDYTAMIEAGLNCFHADPALVETFEKAGVFYWGVSGADLSYPECLYQPLYLGPALFLDEPAVVTRDSVLRPRLRDDETFRREISPAAAMDAFKTHFAHVIAEGAPVQLMRGLAAREDVDLGTMELVQPNLYSWETMVSAAAYELLYHPDTPGAIVFEPPGQLGTRRTVPAWNMSYGCQIPVAGRDHFIDVIIGFLRGAARASGKEWGISIYGGVDRVEAPAFISRAYELGATRFFYWDNARLACVPFGEVLDLTRHLTTQAREYPERDLDQLRNAAEVVILFPAGYNLGHVFMGKGMLWGVPELNLERTNSHGVAYRTVMGNLFTEIERCLRLGVAFDLLWDIPEVTVANYREVVRIREDGTVEVTADSTTTRHESARRPERPAGAPPRLEITLGEAPRTAPCTVTATATIQAGDAPVYYAPAPNGEGVHPLRQVLWELYGPEDADYAHRAPEIQAETAESRAPGTWEAVASLKIAKPGRYRLRAATTDLAGRSTVVWTRLEFR